jgi:AmmeMemoRadiSam system protein B
MSAVERPRLRPHLVVAPEGRGEFLIWDHLRLGDRRIRVTQLELNWLRLLDGQRTLADIHREATKQLDGWVPPFGAYLRLVRELDDALFLEGPRFRSRLDQRTREPIRPPSCTASYGEDPVRIRHHLDRLFAPPHGPGRPGPCRPDRRFRAALVPHIDYSRGGRAFAWGYKELFERTSARLFVIVGTAHPSYHRFTLTRKHFQTPLGLVLTDHSYIDRLVAHYGDGLFADELGAHLTEHSIELEVVFLQHLYPQTPFRIVPLVVGSFQDCIALRRDPAGMEDIARMIEALRAAERETAAPICYIISGDLAHLGPKFGDSCAVSPSLLTHSRCQDFTLLQELGEEKRKPRLDQQPDPVGFFRAIAEEEDTRRICGLPPAYTVLQALQPSGGKLLHYDQYIHPDGSESVSFASMVFER